LGFLDGANTKPEWRNKVALAVSLSKLIGTEGPEPNGREGRQRMTTPQDKPKSQLLAHAPQCLRCKKLMKVRILVPGRKFDDVAYRCEECGDEVVLSVPRPR
jgi:hypothetical protein